MNERTGDKTDLSHLCKGINSAFQESAFDVAYELFTDLEKRAALKRSVKVLEDEERRLSDIAESVKKELGERKRVLSGIEADIEGLQKIKRTVIERLRREVPEEFIEVAVLLGRGVTYDRSSQSPGEIPDFGGVYLLYYGEEVRYIGESYNIRSRIRSYARKEYTSILCVPVSGGVYHRRIVESRLIIMFQPPDNGWIRVSDNQLASER